MPACIAFQLGWDVTRLYRVAAKLRPVSATDKPKLLAQRDFGGTLNTERRMTAVSAGLHRLDSTFERAQLPLPSLAALLSRYTGGAEKSELREAVYRLHLEVLVGLQAADARLGAAYNVGCSFAERVSQDEGYELAKDLTYYRVAGWRAELDELAASFPPHAARAVSGSLCIWQSAVGDLSGAALAQQVEVWRGLLSGERLGTDRLEIDDYVVAGKKLVEEARDIGHSVVRSYRGLLLAGLLIVLLGVGAAALIGGAGGVVAGGAAVASAFGISWKGVGAALSSVAGHLRAPLWGAELDRAVANAITHQDALKAYDALAPGKRRCTVRP